ncbi:MAG: Na/Pi cotransporter family protein [Oscillospiraceae bacterium]|nr:Na/Pi cotransporter family protein [Oscillospiraceae bacterium]
MSVFDFILLGGGLAFFLYGMIIMANGLERASGGRLERALEKLTDNMAKAIVLGAIVTAIIQSSSATTVIIVGLVNARIMKLRQAIGVIMGANIGTTITAHIIRLADIEAGADMLLAYFKPSSLSPVMACIGFALYITSKKQSRRELGHILLGFGVLFSGMLAMEGALSPLRDNPDFTRLFVMFKNPILGVLVGLVLTAIIQSSSASVGILQALTTTGAITFSSAFPIVMGQNIGTCITPVIASINTSRNAKRAAMLHVTIKTIGTVIILIVIYIYQKVVGLPFWDEPISRGGIANFHTLFNLSATLMLAPFASHLEKFVRMMFRAKAADGSYIPEIEDSVGDDISYLDERFLSSPAYAIQQARDAVVRMAHLASENFGRSMELLARYNADELRRAREVEDMIDRLQGRIDSYLLKITMNELTESENIALSEVLQVVNEFERIGDHSDNICDCAQTMRDNGLAFSPTALYELATMREAIDEIIAFAVDGYIEKDLRLAEIIEPLEAVVNILVESLKLKHSERLREGICSLDAAFPFVEVLYNLERIADHCSNVGVHVISYSGQIVLNDRHEFLRGIRNNPSEEFRAKFEMYDRKYFGRINRSESLSQIDGAGEGGEASESEAGDAGGAGGGDSEVDLSGGADEPT